MREEKYKKYIILTTGLDLNPIFDKINCKI